MRGRLALALLVLCPACSKESGGVPGDRAGLLVEVHQDQTVGAEQYRVTVFDGEEAIDLDQNLFPAQPDGALGPVESIQFLLGGATNGWVAHVDVTAMRGGDGVASGEGDSDPLANGRNVTVPVYLEGGTGDDGGGGCDHDSCDGCCEGDVCKPGDADARCGVDGNACLDCADEGGGVCVAGACAPVCRTDNCEGCCDGPACVARKDQSDTTCGTGGVPCVSCKEAGGTCEGGVCEGCDPDCGGRECGPDSCGSTCGDCGDPDETCSEDGACECPGETCAGDCCAAGAVCSVFTGGCCFPLSCEGVECGGDGCGGACGGPCPGVQVCASGTCVCPGVGVECGDDCCTLGEVCASGGAPYCCTPSCDATSACGDADGCGGWCVGPCLLNQACGPEGCYCPNLVCGADCCDSDVAACDSICIDGDCEFFCPTGA